MAKLYLQLNEPGSGEISIPLDNPAAADIAVLKLIELNYRGERHGGFFVENIDRTLVDGAEGEGRWIKASGRGLLAILEEAIIWDYLTDDVELIRHFVAIPKAAMLHRLLTEARDYDPLDPAASPRFCFHVGGIEAGKILLTWDFTETHDSLGNPWTDSETMEFKVGTSLLDVMRQIAALGIDFDIEHNLIDGTLLLHAYANGLGNDKSSAVHFRVGHNCTAVTDSEAGGEIRNVFMVSFPDPVYPWVDLEDVPSKTAYRRREQFLQAASASNAASATVIGQAELDSIKNPKHAISLKISDAIGPRCFVEYKLGDWISYDDGTGTEIKYRIRGIQLEWTDSWYADVVVELNDVFMETQLRNARDLRKIGAASAGSMLKNPLDPTAQAISISDTAVAGHNVDVTAHGGSPVSTALSDFILGSGIGTWIRKTLAETKAILGIPASIGDMFGPATNHADYIPQWNGANSKTLKDGLPIVTSIGTPGANTNIPTEKAVRDAILPRMSVFTFEGILSITSGAVRIYNKLGVSVTISQVFIAVNVAPTDAAITVDVHKNGVTIFTNQAHRPQILSTEFTGFSTTVDVPALLDGDYLTADIDAIGSTIAGANLTVHVIYS